MGRLRAIIKNPRVRAALVIIITLVTLAAFGLYLQKNPAVLESIVSLDASTIALLTLAYVGTVAANAFALWASLRLMRKPVGFFENVALTGYSSVVNFFGPLQSGPGFRALYLKTRHGVSLKRFFYVTLVFYGFFALLNGLVIAAALLVRVDESLAVLLATGVTLLITGLVLTLGRTERAQSYLKEVHLKDRYFWFIGLGALLLALTTAFAYFIELQHVDASITPGQTLVYTAAANLALFVSLTPGAIGFRESFLLLSQKLHEIPTDVVIAASVIDRAFYVVFLLVLFVLLLLVGVRRRITRAVKPS